MAKIFFLAAKSKEGGVVGRDYLYNFQVGIFASAGNNAAAHSNASHASLPPTVYVELLHANLARQKWRDGCKSWERYCF